MSPEVRQMCVRIVARVMFGGQSWWKKISMIDYTEWEKRHTIFWQYSSRYSSGCITDSAGSSGFAGSIRSAT
jgi:hypothetical protein